MAEILRTVSTIHKVSTQEDLTAEKGSPLNPIEEWMVVNLLDATSAEPQL